MSVDHSHAHPFHAFQVLTLFYNFYSFKESEFKDTEIIIHLNQCKLNLKGSNSLIDSQLCIQLICETRRFPVAAKKETDTK